MRSDRPPIRYKQQVRAALRDALLRTAGVALLRDGCPDARVEVIADACGIAKGTAYLQFPSRSALLGGAVQRLDEALAARLSDPPPNVGGPKQTLRWTVMEAVDAQIAALGPRPPQNGTGNGACLWPCCQRMVPCPYGGPARTLSVLERLARAVSARRSRAPAPGELADLLMVASITKLVSPPRRAGAPSHRRFVSRLFDHLLA